MRSHNDKEWSRQQSKLIDAQMKNSLEMQKDPKVYEALKKRFVKT